MASSHPPASVPAVYLDVEMITVASVDARVEQIASIVGDYEAAHGRADKLFDDVLSAIAAGHPQAQALASAALKVNGLGFPRYTA